MTRARTRELEIPTVEEWLAQQRVLEERRARLALLEEELEPLPCPSELERITRVIRPEELNQRPRAMLDHREVSPRPSLGLTSLPVDPNRHRKIGRSE
jgi:hypothetical protein